MQLTWYQLSTIQHFTTYFKHLVKDGAYYC